MNFAHEALCALGVATEPTEIFTRFGLTNPLFWQAHGESLCTFARGARRRLALFCEDGDDRGCPVMVSTHGTTQVITHTSNPVTLEFCAGAFTIRVGTSANYAETSGAVEGGGRVRVVIDESTTENEVVTTPNEVSIVTTIDLGLAVTVSDLPGRGQCRTAVFSEQRAQMARQPM
jgi:hypothetical protein